MKRDDIEHLEWIYGRMVNQLDVNANYDYMLRFNKIINNAYESLVMGEQPAKEDNWIDLDIDNLPERFFTRDDIEIEANNGADEWFPSRVRRGYIINNIMDIKVKAKYRYRIQEKKPIQMPLEVFNLIPHPYAHRIDGKPCSIIMRDGTQYWVEIDLKREGTMKEIIKIIIETILIIVSLAILNSCDMYSINQEKNFQVELHLDIINYSYPVYDSTSESVNLQIAQKCDKLISYKADESGDIWQSIDEIISTGYGDCEDYCKLFINIAYVEYNLKCNMLAVEYSRAIVEGGQADHAIVEMPNGKQVESRNGKYVDYPIGYRFTFDEIFITEENCES